MNKEDICFMSAWEMREKIKTQELTSQEITEAIIERIERINPIVNAYCNTTFDFARDLAKRADDAIEKGENWGLLHGIPVSIKDLMQTKGIKTTYGSKIYEHFIPEENDIAYERLKDAGGVILGKVNTPEFGHIALTKNMIFGETKNPWDTEKNSGGSSGGSAAAVASGLGPLSLGSDGGGSIRIPSSLCGVFGLKPTFGRIPSYPRLGIAFKSMDHYGPIVRYVEDAALMLNVMKGDHPADNNSFPDDNIDYLKVIEEKPKELKIGYTISLGSLKAPEEEVEKNILESVEKFEQFDWNVEQVEIKLRSPELAYKTLVATEYAFDLEKEYNKNPENFSPDIISHILFGLDSNAMHIGRAKEVRKQVYEVFYQYFKKYDILITPTTPCPTFKLEQTETGTRFPTIRKRMLNIVSWMAYTYPFNMNGLPAASIPSGWTNTGLPIGMQIVGKRYAEKTILQVAKSFEEIAPWQDRRPKFET